jgi:diguanylate cyclase (GGDEF)-like protein
MVPCVAAEEFEAEVIRVEKGDLLTVRYQGEELELILYGVTCPFPGQPHGNEARQFTSRTVLHEKIRIQVREWEDESKIVGSVFLSDGSVLNHRLVQNGLASWDRDAAPDDIKLQTLEDFAKKLSIGLWASSTPAVGRTPVEKEPLPVKPQRSKALPWVAMLSTIVALLVVCATVVFFVFQFRKPREATPTVSPPAVTEAPVEDRHSEEKAEAIESGRHAVEELLRSLSEFVSGLVESNMSYDSKMKDHKSSIDQAMTMAGLEEIKRLLTHEIEEIESTSENYRRQLEHANATIRDQQEIMERFRIDAKMDFLTKIANRRAFEARLKEEFERAKRYKSVFTLIMIDIDHFKKVNDVYGHMAGDQILRLIAQVLEDQTRFNDFVCRYGGEEFAVLLPESAADQGRYVADKIRQAVENTSLLYANTKVKVTVSAGVGQVSPQRDTPETFIDRVDAALYRAKENGRNRIELTEEPQDV